ncbi:PfkB family carbohydrate kinase [Planosporangium flavigriseum]|uniref:Carbohydrate kinase n=1 Tax=Planosporangium flavigriseum TaxID=373681 RepID=A0A8J3LZV6_9ACTN|nr:carbohydrate kinase [Planosporangium flavigriseum]
MTRAGGGPVARAGGGPVTRAPHRLVLVGSVLVDILMPVPALPERGGDVLASDAAIQAGGGFNVLAAARRLGLPAALAGRVGDGPFGRLVTAALAAEGIERLMPVSTGDTGVCVGLVEPDAERTFVTRPGVESELTSADLDAVEVRPGDALYVSGYDLCYPVTGPAVAAWCVDLDDSLLVLDPGPLAAEIPPRVLDPVLDRVDVLTLNEREARLLTGYEDLGEVGRALRDRLHPACTLLVRQGARGCTGWLPGRGEPEQVPAPAVAAVDSTGAGDTHTGAFLAALGLPGSMLPGSTLPGSTLPGSLLPGSVLVAVRVANAAAALSVTRAGSATAPQRDELDRLLESWGG